MVGSLALGLIILAMGLAGAKRAGAMQDLLEDINSVLSDSMPELLELVNSIEEKMPAPDLGGMPRFYELYELDLSTARTNEKVDITGDNLLVQDIDGSLTLRVNQIGHDAIDLTKIRQVRTPFDALFFTNTAQTGASAILLIGKGTQFDPIVSQASTPALTNRLSLTTGQKDISAAGTAEQLPDVSIPNGIRVIIMAKPGNTGYIYLGSSKDNAESAINRFDRLGAGDSVALLISNLNLIWADASVNGEGISYIVEQ